jgi:hypothetical protein
VDGVGWSCSPWSPSPSGISDVSFLSSESLGP